MTENQKLKTILRKLSDLNEVAENAMQNIIIRRNEDGSFRNLKVEPKDS